MTKRTVWALSGGKYSSYHVIAVFETKEDAEAVEDRDTYVEELNFYPAGDRSLHEYHRWDVVAEVSVDGKITADRKGYQYSSRADSDGPLDRDELRSAPRITPRWPGRNGRYTVVGTGLTEEQARKGAMDRAAILAAELAQGIDPFKAEREEREARDLQRQREQHEAGARVGGGPAPGAP